MVTVEELIASTQLDDESQKRLQKVLKQVGYRGSDEVDDIVRGLREEDLDKEAALAELIPPLTLRERRALLKKIRPEGQPAVGPDSGQDIARALLELAEAQKASAEAQKASAANIAESVSASGRDTVAGVTEAIKLLMVKDRVSMSTVGSTLAGKVLAVLGFGEVSGHEGMPLPKIAKSFAQCDDFDMSRYFNEAESTPDFVTFVAASLKRAGAAIGTEPGFSVRDLHSSDGKMAIVVNSTTYAGILDAGVVPYAVTGTSCMPQLRIGLELKQTQKQKDVYKANHPADYEQKQRLAKKRKAEPAMAKPADAGGLSYSGIIKGQAVLELLGAYANAEWPLALYVTDGTDWHRLLLYGKELFHWEKLTTRQAMHCMVTELKEASTERDFSLAGSRSARRLRPDQTEPLKLLKPLVGDNALADQLETVLPFVDEEDKAAVALQLIQAHRPCDDEISVPEWLRSMYV